MTIKIWQDFKKLGFLIAPYTLVRCLGCRDVLVLAEIIAEYNYANNNSWEVDGWFFINFKEIGKRLGLDENQLIKSIDNLEGLKFLTTHYSCFGIYMLKVHETTIIEYKRQAELVNGMKTWDIGLAKCQNPVGQAFYIDNLTIRLVSYVNEFYGKKNALPIVTYAYCDALLRSVDENFWDKNNFDEVLPEILSDYDNAALNLCNFIHELYLKENEA